MNAARKLGPLGDFGLVPAELKGLRQWVVWRHEVVRGRKTKVPYQSGKPKAKARTNDPATWSTFAEALDAASDPRLGLAGIGFVFAPGGGLVGADFDNCLDDQGEPLEWAAGYIGGLVGYAEVSPSGRGVKLFVRGSIPGGKGRKKLKLGSDGKGAIEVYGQERFFTVTGRILDREHAAIGNGAAELADLHNLLWSPEGLKARPRIAPTGAAQVGDDEIIARARRGKNGVKFDALMGGSTDGHPSKSEADLALCNYLAFYGGGDVDAIDRIFRRSDLCDEKWTNRPDYRDRTIAKSLDRADFYDPNRGRKTGTKATPVANGHHEGDGPPGDDPSGVDRPPDRPRPNEADDDPHRLARVYLEELKRPEGSTLLFWREEWHRWDGAHYRICPDKEVRGELTSSIKAEFDRHNIEALEACNDKAPPLARQVTTRKVSDVVQALTGMAMIRVVDCPEQPAWLCDDPPFPADEVLPCRNALIHLPGVVEDRKPADCLMLPTPAFFNSYSLGFDYRSDAPPPEAWLKFTRDIWPDDRESIETLQEWFGYLLTADTSQQKMMMMIGPKRSGRGTIARVIQALLGRENVATPTLSGFATHFGAACLIGMPAANFTDARIGPRSDVSIAVERILSITGEDTQTIPRKNLDDWKGRLKTRFTLISNELPRLTDMSGALPSRMIVLRFVESFIGREDKDLEAKLTRELPGILLWAIRGWKRLRERGRFVQPESAKDLVEQMEDIASPVGEFVKDACVVGPQYEIVTSDLYAAWRRWCLEHGKDHPGERTIFGRNLTAAFHKIRTSNPTTRHGHEGKVRVYQGIDLNLEEKAKIARSKDKERRDF